MMDEVDNNSKVMNLEKPYNLIDGATGELIEFSKAVEQQHKIARDEEYLIEERLEAFEDIIDSEVGDTTLWRARNLEREFGLRQLYLKFEGGNPTGTQKDRIAFAQAMDALRRGFQTVTIATCGNYGVAMALAASLAGLRCIVYIPENYHTRRINEIVELGAEIMRVPGDYENAVKTSKLHALENEYYDANPGGGNLPLQLTAYGQISYELYDELRDAPLMVSVPVSNGTTLAGMYKGFLSLYRRGKTSRIPRLVAGSSFKKNPIVQAFVNNRETCIDLQPEKIHETDINEPLINWHSIDGDLALDAIRSTKGWAVDITDKSMISYSRIIKQKEGMSVMPASTAGLIALIERHRQQELPHDRYVAILTGKK